jgi:general stress protein 26
LFSEDRIGIDMEIKKKYWQNLFKDAYPEKSYTDPDFCLLRFTTISGRFYSNFKLEDFVV